MNLAFTSAPPPRPQPRVQLRSVSERVRTRVKAPSDRAARPFMTSAPAPADDGRRWRFAHLMDGVQVQRTNDAKLVSLDEAVSASGTVALIGWLRHYGCTLCKKQASEWLRLQADLPPNTHVLLVGCGRREQAAEFAAEMHWPPENLYSDPQRDSYARFRFAKGLGSLLTLHSLTLTIKSFRDGHKQSWSRIPTDPFQQGGALVVDAQGVIRFWHRDKVAGDHAPLHVLSAAVREAHVPLEDSAVP